MKRRPLRRVVSRGLEKRALRLESLESRALLSGAPPGYLAGPEFRVNTFTAGNQQFDPFNAQNVAMDADGDAVVVWVSDSQDGSDRSIHAQRYAADGTAAGDEFQVSLYTTNNQMNASIAMDADGDFVVTWSSKGQDGSDYGVYARRFNAAGVPRGGEFRVNQESAGYQRLSTIATDAQGNFIVAWAERPSELQICPCQIMGRRYDMDGVPLGDEFQINEPSTDFVTEPHVAVNGRGDYAVVWRRSQAAGTDDVYGRNFAADGTPRSSEFRVHQRTENQQIRSGVAITAAGEVIVTWHNQSTVAGVIEPRHVFMRRFALDGTPLSDDTRVNTSPEPEHRNPAVVVTPAGDSVVTWAGKNFEEPGNNTFGAFLQPYDASGNAVGGETLVNVTTAGQQQFPAIATDADGDFLVAWSSLGQDEGNEFGIYARRFERGADRSPPIVGNVFVGGDEHAMREREVLVQHPERMVVTFSEAIDLSPGGARQQWRLLRNGVDESERLAAATYVFNGAANRHEATLDFQTPLPDGDYELIALPTLRDLSGKMLDGDYDAVGGDAFTRRFTITTPEAKGPQLSIATGDLLIDDGVPGAIARDAAGNFILVWPAAGQGLDIRAQRYDVNGNAVGPEIAVNSLLAGDQKQPTVAMDHDGNFAVVWTSINELGEQDADNEDIYLRRFDSAGNPLGAELRVNVSDSGVTSPFVQQRPTIGMSPTGEFVVAWETSAHPGGGGVDIHFQRFNANGSRSGIETRANFEEEDTQRFPHVAMDAYGDFVLTWTSRRQDGSIPVSDGVYARRFSAAEGTLVGSEFLVHRDDVAGEQRRSTVAMDSSGNFVIAWQSVALGAEDIYAQRYASRLNGALSYEFAVGPRFRVNQQTAGPQQRPVVAMDADGDFVVTWQSNHSPQLNDIKYRRYAWNGTAQSDELAIADVGTPTQQTLPQLAMDSQGNFVLGWHAEESPTPGLFAQRFVGFVNSPPAADAGGSYAIAEGQPLQLNAAGSADVDAGHAAQLRYDWDLDGDGAFDDLVAADALATVTWNTLSSLGVVDDGQYAIFVRVTDPLGGVSVDSATLSLSNTAPSQLVLVTGAAIDEGGEAMVTGTFVDPGFRDEHQLRIDWGDGTIETLSIPAGLQWFSFKHVYVDDNLADSFRITARVIDDDEGMSDPAETSQTVANLAPFSLAVQLSDAREGETLTVVGSFLDAGTGDVHDVYVDWDDGQGLVKLPAAAVVARQFTAAHVYRNNRNDVEIRLRVHDDDGGVVQTTRRVNVENASPANVVLTLAVNVVAVDGLVQLSGTFTDAGLDDRHIVDVFWGDDSSPQSIPLPIGARNFVATYRYPLPTAYVISVTVSDEMDELATGTTTVQIICGVSGDTNADCVVNVADLNAVRNFFGTGVPGGPRVPGDVYPFDGVVNVNDLNQVRNQFGVSAPAPQSNHESTIAPRIDEHSVSRSLTALDAVFARWTNNELPPRLLLDDAGQPRGTQRRKAVMSSR